MAASVVAYITMECSTAGANIYYTLDGTEPTESKTLYTGKFSVTPPATIKARAFKAGLLPSDIVEITAEKVLLLGYGDKVIGYENIAIGWM